MELHKNTTNAFINYLVRHGYPKDSIVTEWGDKNHAVDIAILDNSRTYPVAIYEIKEVKSVLSFRNGMSQLKRFQDYLGVPVKAGLVFAKEGLPYFEFMDVNEYILTPIPTLASKIMEDFHNFLATEPISYNNLASSVEPKYLKKEKDDRKETLDKFKIICWFFVCPIIFGLLMLEGFALYRFTTERLIAMGVFIIIVLLPFFSEIKFRDFILKRNMHLDKKKKSKKID